ncbi:hypothetical protein [Streptomyces altiplanensis]
MATAKPSEAQLCGRLYATLAALQKLSAPGGNHSLGQPGASARAAERPFDRMNAYLEKMGPYFLKARGRGHGEAAAALLRSIPDLLPPGKELPRAFGHEERQEFCESRFLHAQTLREEHPALA